MNKKIVSILLLTIMLSSLCSFSVLSAPISENLVSGLTYTIETGVPISSSFGNIADSGFENNQQQLTDSVYANLSVDSEGWYKAKSGVSRFIIFDLGMESSISYVKAGFLHAKDNDVYAPRYINVWLSDDGENYGPASNYVTNYRLSRSAVARYDALINLDNTFSARYVKIEICCDKIMYCDEIQIFGNRNPTGNEAKVKVLEKTDLSGYPPSISGVSNLIILQNGYNSTDPQSAEYSQSELYPYVVYLDRNGDIGGTMFDGAVFYPCEGAYPSGGSLVGKGDYQSATMSDWEFYIDKTLSDLNALELAVSKAYSKIGLDKKFKVFFTIPFPKNSDFPFGDYDNDGFDEYCRTFIERCAIVQWYVDKCLSEFENSGYSYIALGGFCWGNGEIDYALSDYETELVKNINDYVKNKGFETLFVSNHLAVGFTQWKECGFSDSVMKSDAVNIKDNGFDISVISEAAQISKQYQMGVDIEISPLSVLQGEDYQKAGFQYENFLYHGKKSGYMSGLKTFDQGLGAVFYELCYADASTPKGIYLRRLYDLTFDFIHLTYKNNPPEIEVEDEIELINGDTRITLNFGITDNDSYQTDLKIEFPVTPIHGKVIASANKDALIYSTDDEFVGEDSFTVRVSDGFGYSEEKTIKVTVLAPQIQEPPASQEEKSETVQIVIPNNLKLEDMPKWLLPLLAVLGLAIVVASISAIAKSKKKK